MGQRIRQRHRITCDTKPAAQSLTHRKAPGSVQQAAISSSCALAFDRLSALCMRFLKKSWSVWKRRCHKTDEPGRPYPMQPSNPPAKKTLPSGDLVSLRAAPGDPDPAWQLVEAVRRGESGALNALVTALAPHVLRAVNALLGPSHPDVEDLAQESLLAVVNALPSFRGESTLLHFAIRITTRRMVRSRRRARSILGWLEEHWRTNVPFLSSPRNPHEASLDERRRALLVELLATLPTPQSETLMLRAVLGLSVEEVATATRVPQNTVRSRLRLAKEALRRKIAATRDGQDLLAPEDVP